MCPSPGELYLCDTGICHSVWLIYRLVGMRLIPTSHPPIQSEKNQCRIDTVSSPDDGHIVVRNM